MKHPVKCCNAGSDTYHFDARFGVKLNPAVLHSSYSPCDTLNVRPADSAVCVSKDGDVFTLKVSSSFRDDTTTVRYVPQTNRFTHFEYSPAVLIPAIFANNKFKDYFLCSAHPKNDVNYSAPHGFDNMPDGPSELNETPAVSQVEQPDQEQAQSSTPQDVPDVPDVSFDDVPDVPDVSESADTKPVGKTVKKTKKLKPRENNVAE